MSKLSKGIVPDTWLEYSVPQDITVHAWIVDFIKRIEHLGRVAETNDYAASTGLWVGGLFQPEAYITAQDKLLQNIAVGL